VKNFAAALAGHRLCPLAIAADADHNVEGVMEGPDPFLMSNLVPTRTGLRFVDWSSPRQDDRQSVRIWVSRSAKASPSEMVTISIRPDLRVIEGQMDENDLAPLRE